MSDSSKKNMSVSVGEYNHDVGSKEIDSVHRRDAIARVAKLAAGVAIGAVGTVLFAPTEAEAQRGRSDNCCERNCGSRPRRDCPIV